MKSNEERQEDLERESKKLGIERYDKKQNKAVDKKVESSLKPQRSIMYASMEKFSSFISEELAKENKSGRKPIYKVMLEGVDPDVISNIVALEIVNGLSQGRKELEVRYAIAGAINDHKLLKEFSEKNSGLYRYARDKVNSSSDIKYKRNSLKHYANFAGITSDQNKADNLRLGGYLLRLFIEQTGIVELVSVNSRTKCNIRAGSSKRTTLYLKVNEETKQWLKDQHEELRELTPWLQPMIVPPRPWTNTLDGGYLLDPTPFIKGYSYQYLDDLNSKVDLSTVFKAVNAVQNTAWKINDKVLDIFEKYFPSETNEGIESLIIPSLDEKEYPQMPCQPDTDSINEYKALDPDGWARWKQEKHKVHSYNKRNEGKYITCALKLNLAKKFRDEEELYFPHNIDFRGRVYPLVPLLNPQSDDLGKALLKFAYGEELGEHGEYWLKVHLANSYGIDKESFDDRVAWTEEHRTHIQMVALDPLLCRGFWEAADKPWQFLAACYEYADYIESGLGKKFVSSLPISLDGSCNGIQHFSAMLKDEVGGSAVNLTPADKPADVYQQVADKVEEKLRASDDPLASTWIGKVTRKLVKRQVMTLPYGATQRGMEEQLKEELDKALDDGIIIIDTIDFRDELRLIKFLTKIILQAISETLIASVKMMDWLKESAKIITKTGQPIQWTTPVGFKAMQSYKHIKWKEIDTKFNHIRLRGRYITLTDKLDGRKQSSSISPNVVHSMDAAHMISSINRMVNKGVQDFSMVHDSYAVHAGHVQDLTWELRDTFIEQYSNNFCELFKSQLETTHKVTLPELPPQGNLDLTLVKDSMYFFN